MGNQLYALSDEYVLALQKMEEAGFDAETIKDTLDGMSGDLQDKIRSVAYAIINAEALIPSIDSEIARLTKRKNSAANSADRMKAYLLQNMIDTGVTVEEPTLSVKLANKATQLGELDEKLIPKSFFTTPPRPAPQLDKKALLAAAKLKPVKGVKLLEGQKRLSIK